MFIVKEKYMKLAPRVVLTATIVLIIAGMSDALHAQGEKKIKQKDLPAAVQSAFNKSYPNAKISGAAKEVENGKTYYEIESVDGKMKRDLLYTPEGAAYEIEETIPASDLPQSVKDALQKQFQEYTITKAEKTVHGTALQYDVVLKSGKKGYEVSVGPAGKILSSEQIKAKKEKKEEDEEDDED